MLTQCPQCGTVYRLYAEQLSVARGFVTCAACECIFDALARLADEAAPAPPASVMSVEQTLESSVASAVASRSLANVPAVLRDDVERLLRKQHRGLRTVWLTVALLAASMLLTQIGWAKRGWVFDHYPAIKPHVSRLCDRVACRLDRPPSAAHIELVARDVREHPEYAHALLVNATLANRGESVSGYPVIQLGVYDRNGSVVGIRRFLPTEYLDQSININAGMSPGRSIHVVLEVANANDVAESFEFSFL
ncbi:MAG: DUF3426 domain-containing protein [Gammaproteobacteria bacterium]|nr:DUF3426 domain-containing protein [Gammaproteobacteria bacterium]